MSSRSLFDGSNGAPERRARPSAEVKSENALTVSELVARLKAAVEPPFRDVWVAGEITGFRQVSAAGHAYFALKDGAASIQVKIWKSTLAKLRILPENGAAVVAHGSVDLYAPTGALSLTLDKLIPQGVGQLAAAFEQLRKKLLAEGLFAPDRKRPIPRFPRAIGLVTSREGAAIRDFLRHLNERFPTRVVLVASQVQGAAAPETIASAIFELSDNAKAWGLDVIAVVRGGGSMEDLAAFNAEVVARAIAASSVPVVTGVGHEIDTTIADLVADARAKTPTDAANVVVPDREGLVNTLTDARDRLAILADRALSFLESDLDTLEARLAARGPRAALAKLDVEVSALGPRLRAAARERIERAAAELERLRSRLRTSSPLAVLAERRRRFDLLAAAIRAAIDARLAAGQQRLEVGAARLAGVSPVAILGRGYSLTRRTGDAGFLRSAEGLHVGDAVETRLARGAFRSRVERVETEAQES